MVRWTLVMLLAMACAGWARPTVKIGEITWYTNYEEALKMAREARKPLWLHFGENPG